MTFELFNFKINQEITCSFCGKSESQVGFLIQGPGGQICDELCHKILEIEKEKQKRGKNRF